MIPKVTIPLIEEDFFHKMILDGTFYLKKDDFHLEYDPETRLRFIHTSELIGESTSKKVTKSILYGDSPLICANAHYPLRDDTREITCLKELKGVNRVIQLIASPIHTEGQETIQELITEFYPLGTLADFDTTRLTLQDKICMARDLMEGLMGAHARNITHNDLNNENVLVEKDAHYRLIIADWGSAKKNFPLGYVEDVAQACKLIFSFLDNALVRDMLKQQKPASHWYKELSNL